MFLFLHRNKRYYDNIGQDLDMWNFFSPKFVFTNICEDYLAASWSYSTKQEV